jgi:hypothetical protein
MKRPTRAVFPLLEEYVERRYDRLRAMMSSFDAAIWERPTKKGGEILRVTKIGANAYTCMGGKFMAVRREMLKYQ